MTETQMPLTDQSSAGKALAESLVPFNLRLPVILALAPGGVPVAEVIARSFAAEMDVVVARSLFLTEYPGLTLGAVARNGVTVLDQDAVMRSGISEAELDELVAQERAEMKRRIQLYRREADLRDIKNRDTVVVSDGTDSPLAHLAILRALRSLAPSRLILATVAVSADHQALLRREWDDLAALIELPEAVTGRGLYENYLLPPDDDVEAVVAAVNSVSIAPPA